MSALSFQAFRGPAPATASLRFGSAAGAGERSVQWLLRRNCSMTPTQIVAFYLSLCAWSLAIAGAFWWRGATYIMPFACIELIAIGAALIVHARHVAVFITREITGDSWKHIGGLFGDRDHTSMMHGYQKVSEMMRHDKDLRAQVKMLIRNLYPES